MDLDVEYAENESLRELDVDELNTFIQSGLTFLEKPTEATAECFLENLSTFTRHAPHYPKYTPQKGAISRFRKIKGLLLIMGSKLGWATKLGRKLKEALRAIREIEDAYEETYGYTSELSEVVNTPLTKKELYLDKWLQHAKRYIKSDEKELSECAERNLLPDLLYMDNPMLRDNTGVPPSATRLDDRTPFQRFNEGAMEAVKKVRRELDETEREKWDNLKSWLGQGKRDAETKTLAELAAGKDRRLKQMLDKAASLVIGSGK